MDSPLSHPSKPKGAELILLGLCALVILVFYGVLPIFRVVTDCSSFYVLAKSWTDETGYTHGWFIVPAMIGIIWKNWAQIKKEPIQPSNWGLVLVIFSLFLFVIGVRTIHWRISLGALPILIYGMLIYLWGTRRASYFIFPLALFYFCVPLPGLIQATSSLQLIVTKFAAKLASLCGIALDLSGNKVYLLGKGDFDVDEGCSGIRSLMALLLIAFVFGYFTHKAGWKRTTIFLSAIPLAIIANILRIFSILFVADKISVSFAQTIYHDKVGFLSFGIALGLLLLLSRILEKGFRGGPKTIVKRSGPATIN
jgi:exosortase